MAGGKLTLAVSPRKKKYPQRQTLNVKTYTSRSKKVYNRNLYKKVRDTTEYKHIDKSYSGYANKTGSLTLLNGLATNVVPTGRIGAEILMKSITMRLHFYTTASCPSQAIRYMLVYVKQPQGQAPILTDLVPSVEYLKAETTKDRFFIIYDKTFIINQFGTSGDRKFITKYKKMSLPVDYSLNNNGIITDIDIGALYLLILGTEVSGSTDAQFKCYNRIYFTDK